MLQSIVKKIFSSNKDLLGVSLTPEAGLEVIKFNLHSNVVESYTSRHLHFNPIKKMVEDFEELSKALETVLDELNVEEGTPVVVNLPSFCFNFMDVETIYADTPESRHNAILSEVEQLYMFKQNIPIVSEIDVPSNNTNKPKIAYVAVQKDLISDLNDVFNGLGLSVVAYENSYSSLLKTVQYFGFAREEMTSNANWGLISVNQNSYTIFSLIGDNLYDTFEEPLAIKTFEKDEVNYAVASVINSNLQYYNFSSLLIINNSPDINALDLANQLEFSNKIQYVENNGLRIEKLVSVSNNVSPNLVSQISCYVLGAAIYNALPNYILKFNLNDEAEMEEIDEAAFKILGVPVELNDTNWIKMIVIVLMFTFVVFGFVNMLVYFWQSKLNIQLDKTSRSISDIQNEMKLYEIKEVHEFNYSDEILRTMQTNKYSAEVFDTLAANIPKNTWLTYFYTNHTKATIIRGRAYSSSDIYQFFKNIKLGLPDNDFSLSKISVAENVKASKEIYEFEITNNNYNNLVDIIKQNDKDYVKQMDEQKKAVLEKYKNSYFPLIPTTDGSVKAPSLSDSDSVYVEDVPSVLPPT